MGLVYERVVYDSVPLQALRQFQFLSVVGGTIDAPVLSSVTHGATAFLDVVRHARQNAGLDATDSESRNRAKARPWGTLSFCVRPNVVLQAVLSHGWTLKKEGRVVDTGEWALTLRDPESFISALVAWCES